MPTPTEVGIYAAGAASALGLSLGRHAAMVRAGLGGGGTTEMLLRDGTPLRAGFVAPGALPPLCQHANYLVACGRTHEGRLLQLADNALREAAQPVLGAAPLFVALPAEADEGRARDRQTVWLDLLWAQTQAAFARDTSRLYAGGAGAFFAALAAAADYAATRRSWVLVGAVDSDNDDARLRRLDAAGRLARPTAADGVVPGEGACFVLLGPMAAVRGQGQPWAKLGPVGLGHEPGHRGGRGTNLATGLTEALAQALSSFRRSAEPPREQECETVATLLAADNGCRTHAQEGAVACMRHHVHLPAQAPVQRQASYTGDAGVALPALQLATAALHLSQEHLRGPVLLWTVDDSSARGAVVLRASSSQRAAAAASSDASARAQEPAAARAWFGRADDTALTDAAYLYARWRDLARRGDYADPARHRLEQRLGGPLDLLTAESTPARLVALLGEDGTEAKVYPVLRVALAAGAETDVFAILRALPWSRRAWRQPAIDALVHGWRGELQDELLAFFGAIPERIPALARLTLRLHLDGARARLANSLQRPGTQRASVVRALASVASATDRGLLTLQLNRRDAPVRRAAALGLLRLGGLAGLGALGQNTELGAWPPALAGPASSYASLCAMDAEASNLPQTTLALGVFGSPLALPTLLARLGQPHVHRQVEAALYLITGARQTQAGTWASWWREHQARFDVALRYRLGRAYDAAALLASVDDVRVPVLLRRTSAIELELRFQVACPFDRFLLTPQWRARLELAGKKIVALGEFC